MFIEVTYLNGNKAMLNVNDILAIEERDNQTFITVKMVNRIETCSVKETYACLKIYLTDKDFKFGLVICD